MMATLRCLALVALADALASCGTTATPMSTFAPQSDYAHHIHSLYLEVIGWDTLILLVVTVALLLALLRYSTRSEVVPEQLPATHEHIGLEVAWTVGPAVILLAIAIPTVRTTFRSQPAVAPQNALIVNVIAHQWWWEVHYPDLQISTANEIHLPVGRPVRFQLQSADVIHSFWVPQLGGKQDVVPGHTNTLTLTPQRPGMYFGQCAEFCGLSHANMRFRVFVDTPQAFHAWSTRQTAPAAVPGRPAEAVTAVQAGARLYAESPCVTCHTIRGVSTQKIGPDLTHFGSRTTLAGGTLDNTPQNLGAWLRDPPALKPGAQMPDLGLSQQQAAQLVAYLESLK
jgi:cytochrome c oxidase subunit 2